MSRSYLHQLGIAVDQLLNTVLSGYADETLSARAYRCQYNKKRWMVLRKVLDGLFFWQTAHCYESYLSELDRKHYPNHYSTQDSKV